ncbi:VanW family protein [Microgenomates group bacterium]|nr:VanW family protein [Microgenomates group bacterium]
MRPVILKLSVVLLVFSVTFILVAFFLRSFYHSHLFPSTFIADINLSNYNYPEAMSVLAAFPCSPSQPTFCPPEITLAYQDISLASSGADLHLRPDFDALITNQLSLQSSLSLPAFLSSLRTHLNSPQFLSFHFFASDDSIFTDFLHDFESLIFFQGQDPKFILDQSGRADSLRFVQGETSRSLDYTATLAALKENLSQNQFFTPATIILNDKSLTPNIVEQHQSLAASLVSRSIVLTPPENYPTVNFSLTLSDQDLISCLDYDNQTSRINVHCLVDLTLSLRELIDREAQTPVLELNASSTRADLFTPPADGLVFNQAQTVLDIQKAIVDLLSPSAATTRISLPASAMASPPAVSLESINSLGIKEVIGFGESFYTSSSANRIHNVALSAERISGVIIAPNQEFSFNQTLGPVTLATGFREEYIISQGASTMGVGGGVCQTSSTLFRALLNSGLKITRRLPHSFRVSYYEINNDPGFDATVYSGEVDLRFVNDTDHHILIYMHANSARRHMFATIYGTSDGRYSEVVDYHKAALGGGAMRTSFVNITYDKYDQEIRRDTFVSNYAVPKQSD